MNLSDESFELTEAYEEGRLSADQRQQFEQRLLTDAALQQALTEYRAFRHSLEAVRLKERLSVLHERLAENGTLMESSARPYASGRRVGFWRWVAAVSVLLVIGLAGTLFYRSYEQQRLAQEVFFSFYRPEPIMRGGNDCATELMPIISQYRNGQYGAALSALAKQSASASCTAYYRGLCQVALHQPDAAIESLDAARLQSTGFLRQRAEWYLALAHLDSKNLEAGREQLDIITKQPGHPFGLVARQALGQLAK